MVPRDFITAVIIYLFRALKYSSRSVRRFKAQSYLCSQNSMKNNCIRYLIFVLGDKMNTCIGTFAIRTTIECVEETSSVVEHREKSGERKEVEIYW